MSFQVCAHRGDSNHFPENTLAAFASARQLGVERMEFDVRRTGDGALVILHDATVDRTTNGSGPIWELTLCAARSLDAGLHKGEQFAGQRVPTFAETLQACPMICNVNVYPGPHDLNEIVDEVIAELRRQERLADSFIAASAAVVDRVAQVEPALECCLLDWASEPERHLDECERRGLRNLQPSNRIVDAAFCAEAHRRGMSVHPFYADDVTEMRRLIAAGVDGILTNEPALLQRVLGDG